MKGLAVADHHDLTRYASLQAYYNLVARELEHELLPLARDQGVGVLVWSPLAQGFLTGKQRRGQAVPETSRRAALGDPGTIDKDQGFDVVDALDDIAKQRGVTIPQVALNWLLRRPGVTSVIIGARDPDQLSDNLAAATWELSADEVDRLDQVSDRPLPYPYWHQRKFAGERLVR
jgi:aryl-alcohol dehydrogenase-like predicted oxidoreductase